MPARRQYKMPAGRQYKGRRAPARLAAPAPTAAQEPNANRRARRALLRITGISAATYKLVLKPVAA
eukprot:10344140-Lingulodinium_polyedra.AAC.1